MPLFIVDQVEIDTAAREVRLAGQPRPLEPRAFEALVYLIENRGRTVSKQDLLDAVWQGRVVTDSVLTQAIAKCRRVLEDSDSKLIKTVHRVGYRFDGPTMVAPNDQPRDGLPAQTLEVVLAVTGADAHRLASLGRETQPGAETLACESVADAVALAMELQGQDCVGGIGVHAGTVSAGEGAAVENVAAQLALAGLAGQILLSATGFELGRADAAVSKIPQLAWLAHGTYQFAQLDSILSLFEVGVPGSAPMQAPPDQPETHRALADDIILGWRAAPGQPVPGRSHWLLQRCLGEGGFGEAWLAQHEKTHEKRVFKFCYRADRLRSLKREVTLFRLLLESLGDRPDIARILDWNFDEPPYFLESEYTAQGDLRQWIERQGGVAEVAPALRLRLAADTARALAAAHAVGVLHKDVKPANILIRLRDDEPRAALCDFGIGLITDGDALQEHDITQTGITEALAGNVTSVRTGTRRYMAPEVLEGQSATIQADLYSLGVVVYQLAVGNFDQVLAPGWERDIPDEVLRDDIARLVDRDPGRRPGDANLVAEQLETLEARRAALAAERAAAEKAERDRRRRRLLVPAVAATSVIAVALGLLSLRVNQEAKRANAEAARAQAVSSYLTQIFDSANPYQLKGKDLSAKDLLDVGARSLPVNAALAPQARTQLYVTMGRAYAGLMDFEASRAMLLKADEAATSGQQSELKLARLMAWANLSRLEGDLPGARAQLDQALALAPQQDAIARAQVLESRAAVENLDLKHAAAVPLLEEAITLRSQTAPAADVFLLRAKAELAETLTALGQHGQAESLFAQVIESYGEDQPAAIEAQQAYAGLLLRTDRLHEAWVQAHRAYTTAQQHLPVDHPALADAADTLATTLMPQGNFEEAEKLQQAAYQIRQAALGDHPKTAQSVTRLANLYMNTDDYSLARQYFKETFRLNEELYGSENYMSAASLVDYALLLFDFPEAYEEAVASLEQAVDIFDRTLGDQHWATGMAYLYLSRGRYLVQDLPKAEADGARAVTIMNAAYPDGGYRHSLAYLQHAAVRFAQGEVAEAKTAFDEHFPILAEHRDTDAEDYQVALEIYQAINAAAEPQAPARP
ncbi:MAG: tetratricopeptide repeat protein [Pseudomonadota bacterium]